MFSHSDVVGQIKPEAYIIPKPTEIFYTGGFCTLDHIAYQHDSVYFHLIQMYFFESMNKYLPVEQKISSFRHQSWI
jgi:hypothetical protein